MAKSDRKLQKIDPLLIKTIDDIVRTELQSCQGQWPRQDQVNEVTEHCVECVELFLYGKVHDARVVLFDRTPMVRVSLRYGKKSRSVDKMNPLRNLIDTFPASTLVDPTRLQDEILPLLPQELVAMQMADIENASAAVLLDPKKTAKVRTRLQTIYAADKERLLATIRRALSGHNGMITETEVIQLWRECLCAEVQDS